MSRQQRRRFATVERWSNGGWYAVTKGMCSGPWDTDRETQTAADTWNAAVGR